MPTHHEILKLKERLKQMESKVIKLRQAIGIMVPRYLQNMLADTPEPVDKEVVREVLTRVNEAWNETSPKGQLNDRECQKVPG